MFTCEPWQKSVVSDNQQSGHQICHVAFYRGLPPFSDHTVLSTDLKRRWEKEGILLPHML